MKIRLLNKFEDSFNQIEIENNCQSVINYFNFYCLCLIDIQWTINDLFIYKAGYDSREGWSDNLYYVRIKDVNIGFISDIPKDYK